MTSEQTQRMKTADDEHRLSDEQISEVLEWVNEEECWCPPPQEVGRRGLQDSRCMPCLSKEAITQLSTDLTEARSQLEEAREGLRKIYNCGQSIEPDHWKFRCMARDVARDTLSRLSPSPKQGAGGGGGGDG